MGLQIMFSLPHSAWTSRCREIPRRREKLPEQPAGKTDPQNA
jgi:hypothetical protein